MARFRRVVSNVYKSNECRWRPRVSLLRFSSAPERGAAPRPARGDPGAVRAATGRGRRGPEGGAGAGAEGGGRREARPGDARPGREMSAEAAQAGSRAGTAAPGPGPGMRPPSAALSPRTAPDGGGLFGWLRGRCLGRSAAVDPARDSFRAMTGLYGSIQPADSVYLSTRTHGAVFNLEYSPDGYGPRPAPRPSPGPGAPRPALRRGLWLVSCSAGLWGGSGTELSWSRSRGAAAPPL